MKKILVCILFILGLLSVESKAQKVAVKSNLLYDATTTMNLGLEVALARKWTLDIPVNYNPWKFDDARLKHWGIQPELRYWFCESFNRTFIGLHAHYADFTFTSSIMTSRSIWRNSPDCSNRTGSILIVPSYERSCADAPFTFRNKRASASAMNCIFIFIILNLFN